MAKNIIVSLDGEESSFAFKAVDRASLYGKRRRIALDKDGNPCSRGSLLEDGSLLLKSGMSGQGYFLDDGTFLKQSDLEGFDINGNALNKAPSTLGQSEKLTGPVNPNDVLDLRVKTIYVLEEENLGEKLKSSLAQGNIYQFTFNYREDYHAETAFILSNENGIFVLIGDPVDYNWLSLNITPVINDIEIDDSEELDFEML
jgi:hypothetical protein